MPQFTPDDIIRFITDDKASGYGDQTIAQDSDDVTIAHGSGVSLSIANASVSNFGETRLTRHLQTHRGARNGSDPKAILSYSHLPSNTPRYSVAFAQKHLSFAGLKS